MRKIFLLLNFCFIAFFSIAQIGINTGTPWEFLKGDSLVPQSAPVYGNLGTEAEGNRPGRRAKASTWIDGSGYLWLYGGSDATFGGSSDLWKYDPTINQWTFMKGNSAINSTGVYGTQGIEASGNKPGARRYSIAWIDTTGPGKLWLFGGEGYPASGGAGFLNDFWKYDPVTNNWTWINGNNTSNAPGNYGSGGNPSPTNIPGARNGSVSWTDIYGQQWLFGGYGYDENGNI